MVRLDRRERKEKYFKKFGKVLSEYDKCFVVCADNVRSKQMQQIRIALRGSAEIVFGKNTQMRKVIGSKVERDSRFEKLLPLLRQNVGLVFTVRDLHEIRAILESNRLEAPAKAGSIAPKDVVIPAQNTGLGPEKTNVFQAMAIHTKITRGTIEILNDVAVIKKGNKVGASEAALLKMLKINPFDYGLVIRHVFDQGSVYGSDVLDITTDDIINKFLHISENVTALSLAISYPTVASVSHMISNAFKNLVAISIETNYDFKEAKQMKDFLQNPEKFAVAAPAASPAVVAPKVETKAPEPVKEESESEDSDLGMGLFD